MTTATAPVNRCAIEFLRHRHLDSNTYATFAPCLDISRLWLAL